MGSLFNLPSSPVKGSYTSTTESSSSIYTPTTYAVVSLDPIDGQFATIAEAVSSLPSEGGTVFIKKGTHSVSSTISLPDKDLKFLGEDGTLISTSDMSSGDLFYLSYPTGVVSFDNIRFTTSFDDTYHNFINVYQPGSSFFNLRINNCGFRFISVYTDHTAVQLTLGSTYGLGNCSITNSVFFLCNIIAGGSYDHDANKLLIGDNTFTAWNAGTSISVTIGRLTGSVIIKGNTITEVGYGNTKDKISVSVNCYNVLIEGNSITFEPNCGGGGGTGYYLTGIYSKAVKNKITNNVISLFDTVAVHSRWRRGIFLEAPTTANVNENITIANNQISFTFGEANEFGTGDTIGIITLSRNNGIISNNTIYIKDAYSELSVDISRMGIYLGGSTDNVVVNSNSIKIDNDFSSTTGIYIGATSNNCAVIGNTLQVGTVSSVATSDLGTNNALANNVVS